MTSIALSKDQSVWFGMKGGGIVRYDQNSQNGHTWTRYKQPTIQSNIVNAIACDLSESSTYGEVWLTSSLGIDRFIQISEDRGEWHYLGGLPFRYSQNTVAVRNQIDNSIWIGSDGDGLAVVKYDPILTVSSIALPAGANSRVTGIAFEGQSIVWIAKENGVSFADQQSGSWTHYDHANAGGYLPAGEIHAVETDLHLQRWFGTDSGLIFLSDTTWNRFTTSNSSLPNNVVTAIKYDLRGNLWIGTRNGLAVYNPEGTRF